MHETGGSGTIDPGREVVEAHHHLWPHARMPADWPGSGGGPDGYRLRELYADLCTGHDVVQTVFLQCGASYRAGRPEHLRPVGETEWVAQIARQSRAGDFSEADKDALFSGTARRVYRLPAPSRRPPTD